MSQIQTAFIEKSRIPERAQLEDAVRALGFDLPVDEFYRPFDCSGFLPCVLQGKQSEVAILRSVFAGAATCQSVHVF